MPTETQQLVSALYKDEKGDPIILTPGQDDIFRSISMHETLGIKRLHVMCHTRYGKSLTVGLSVLTRAATFPEKWAIIAGTKDKAKIIMDYVIGHIFDNDFTKSRFTPDDRQTIEDIRRYRNKNRITFKTGESVDPVTGKKINLYGEVFIGSAADALGFGAPNVVEDESALVNDNDHSLVVRMLGDHPKNNFMVKIGNPFARNHFLKSYHDPKYKKIALDCYKSLSEGRITQETIDENRDYSFFPILYECKFPRASEIDESGYMYLLSDDEIKRSIARDVESHTIPLLGIDVMRGGRNYNVWVKRTGNVAEVLKKTLEDDLNAPLEDTLNLMREHGISPENVFVDDSGIGGGLTDMLKARNCIINPINFGEGGEKEIDQRTGKALSSEYANVRAEVYAGKNGLQNWIKTSGHLKPHKDWLQLTQIRYKKDLNGRTKIEPKEDMRKRGVESPDVADALALTFARRKTKKFHMPDPATILMGGVKPFYNDMPG